MLVTEIKRRAPFTLPLVPTVIIRLAKTRLIMLRRVIIHSIQTALRRCGILLTSQPVIQRIGIIPCCRGRVLNIIVGRTNHDRTQDFIIGIIYGHAARIQKIRLVSMRIQRRIRVMIGLYMCRRIIRRVNLNHCKPSERAERLIRIPRQITTATRERYDRTTGAARRITQDRCRHHAEGHHKHQHK